MVHDFDFPGANTNYNKLAGTVYDLDFDDDMSNEKIGDLKAMRERRKSVDIHERKSDSHHASDASPSPKFTSPTHNSYKRQTSYNTGLNDLRPPTPIEKLKIKAIVASTPEQASTETSTNQSFPDIVPPVLPGPVDMRTYNSFDNTSYSESNLLNAFSSGTAEATIHEEIDEDFEKELHSALKAGMKKDEPAVPEVSNIKVSLSDSRNQLKVKIKGPIANYTATASTPVASETSNASTHSSVSANNAVMSSGGSNLRRMRKKELLRQYWTQENMDEPSQAPGLTSTPVAPPRNIITIPKAVASMTSIPTKDDYSNYRIDDIIETAKPHKKDSKNRPMIRELKHLDLSLEDDIGLERRRSIGSTGSNNSSGLDSINVSTNKRRGRPPRNANNSAPIQTTPKLKIKFGHGNNSIVGATATPAGNKVDDKRERLRPPKKRLASVALPSMEDLKRESMKFRKHIMAGFGHEKRKRKDKSEKRKRKKFKGDVQIISNESSNPTKLIIRFGKKTEDEAGAANVAGAVTQRTSNSEVPCSEVTDAPAAPAEAPPEPPKDNTTSSSPPVTVDSEKSDSVRIMPIKLKLARCQEGSGYVMKQDSAATSGEPPDPPPDPPPALPVPDVVHKNLLLNKNCEVR